MLVEKNCACEMGYYMANGRYSCMKCDDSCSECVNKGDDSSRCTICANHHMEIDNSGKCVCPPGSFLTLDKSDCTPCIEPCFTCTNDGYDH